MLDIVFISYDEPNADDNYTALKARFPHAKRVHGVKGIAEAHVAASKKANTSFFYVVDGDAEISPNFNFDYKPTEHEAEYVHIWKAYNPATGDAYGYGGVKLFAKKFFKNLQSYLDFSTSLTKDIKIIDDVACTTRFNSDPFRAFRGAYRETVKLRHVMFNGSTPEIMNEAHGRLFRWNFPLCDAEFRTYIQGGVKAAHQEFQHDRGFQLSMINDHIGHCKDVFVKMYPEVDLDTTPSVGDSKLKKEMLFTTRIASALYDPYVKENLSVEELRDALSDGQLLSKTWLIEKLIELTCEGKMVFNGTPEPDEVIILGGWIGTLALLFNAYDIQVNITSVDTDVRANRIAETLNYDYKFKTVNADMYDIVYDHADMIINTSSEHIPDISGWRARIPGGKTIIVQNNNFDDGDGHISNVKNSAELRELLNLSEVFYEGTRKFKQYSRFMIIGKT